MSPVSERHTAGPMARLTYNVPELAAVLGISPSHVRRLAKAGRLPVLSIPGRTLFARAAIHAWMRQETNHEVAS